MEAIPLWLQNITFSLLGGWITVTHHKNQVAPGSKVSGAHTFKTLHSSRAYRLQSLPWDSSFLLVKMTHCFLMIQSHFEERDELTSRSLKAMWNILGLSDNQGVAHSLKKKKIITVSQKQIFPSFTSPSKPVQFFCPDERFFFFFLFFVKFSLPRIFQLKGCGDLSG